ncbi:MAG: hypothetical protein K8R59_04260 [Thermoanaerobaculales bacterium]|nr:hypothetical protein [Thermoanaerobaculales bacterium]
MNFTKIAIGSFVLTAVLFSVPAAQAAEPALWLRYPAISPDGAQICFSYRGNLWLVPSTGGRATALTVHSAHDFMPVWSSDGRNIAFASDRYGDFDLFLMPAEGGEATRLTTHSANDYPSSFTPDGQHVLFSSGRLDSRTCVQYPRRGSQPELYSVAISGGMPEQVLSTPAIYAVFDSDGGRLAYSDNKGLESQWRKHDNSSFARDIWLFDTETGQHTRLTEFGADDRQPVWGPDEQQLYYLSESDGNFNVWQIGLEGESGPEQLTRHTTHPVRFLSASQRGDLCYAFDGDLWVREAGSSESHKIEVEVAADSGHNQVQWINVADQISEFELSPNGKELVFIARGEVFVTSADHETTRRMTDTPEQERSVSFSPDGRSLLYASERNGSWNLYRLDLEDEEEPNFFNATATSEKPILETAPETFQPRFSPDGKEVAYLEERTALKVLNIESGESREILPADLNYSYADGDQWYEWSPDGLWFLVEFLSHTRWSSEVGLVPSSGEGELINLTKSGYEDVTPRWAMEGEAVFWFTDRHGDRLQAGWPSAFDVYAAYLTREAWEKAHLTEAELEQRNEKKKKEEKEKAKDSDAEKEDSEDNDAPKIPDPVEMHLDGLEDRTQRLTLHSSRMADARLTPDGEKLLYLAKFEKGYDLWLFERRKKEVKLLAKLKAKRADSLVIDSKGKKAFVLADNKLTTVEIEGGKTKPVKLSAKMQLDAAAEKSYFFEHAWRQTLKKFYVKDMQGVDWRLYKQTYAKFLPHINNNWDFSELLSELQGELNASHLGCYYRPKSQSADQTATLAFFPDPSHKRDGILIAEVIDGSPLQRPDTKVKPGVIIESIGGEKITAGSNWYPLLNHRAGTLVRLALFDPENNDRWQEAVKPISLGEENRLLYNRWVRSRRAEVDRLSGGRLGYAHIKTMNDPSFREIFEDVFGKAVDKEAIILDTRFNNGGNLVEALTIFLTGEVYTKILPRGQDLGVEPGHRWTKPSIIVMNEGNYSDAHCFPAAYSSLEIGEMVGMPVPGTCTSVWWEKLQDRSMHFGIPMVGYIDNEGDMLENKHLAPDYPIDNDPALEAAGRDQQLEKAVEVLLATLDS